MRRLTGLLIAGSALIVFTGCYHMCPTSASVPNAKYIGPYKGEENNLSPEDMAKDLYCAHRFKSDYYPNGFVTIYGSSRIKEKNDTGNKDVDSKNNKLYQEVRSFAYKWTKLYGHKYPIMTGAGPGLMEAGSRGAMEAQGKSIGYTTYYDQKLLNDPSPYPYGGDASLAFTKYDSRDIITEGLIFSSVAMRESAMIMHSAAVIIAPGGSGTEWEAFQVLETIKSKQLKPVPVFIVGEDSHWNTFKQRIQDMYKRGTVKEDALAFEHVLNAEDVVEKLKIELKLHCP